MKTRILILLTIFMIACGTDNPFDGNDKVEIDAAKGDQGPSGTNGNDGTNGQDGKDGINGTNGQDGKPGANGKDGINGKNGEDGRDGEDGKDGKDGKDGQMGPPGPMGNTGPQGPAGANGQPCTVQDYGSYIRISCPGSMPVTMNKPEDNLTVCVWVDPFCVQTISARMSDINSGMYDIAHIGPCRM